MGVMSHNARPKIDFIERRASDRTSVVLPAYARHPDGARFPCRFRNISDGGAMLEFLGSHVVMLGTCFELVLEGSDVVYRVKLVWRKDRSVGVLFID
jgi:c-di-GMP-binding flagellar brake protein YcgR